MPVVPITAMRKWLMARLKADFTLMRLVSGAIYYNRVPRINGRYPCVLIAYQGLSPNGAGATAVVPSGRVVGALLFIAQGVVREGDTSTAEAIAASLERLLGGATGDTEDYRIEGNEIDYERLGAIYAISLTTKIGA